MPHLTKHTDISSGIHSAAWLLLLALATFFVAACGDESAPPPVVGPPPITVESGFFDVITGPGFNGCDKPDVYDGNTYEIQINGTAFSMGDDWTGTWNPNTLLGSGSTEPISNTFKSCIITTWTSVNITFSSEDEFSGSILFRRRLRGDCENFTPCTSSWQIAGVRK